MATTLNTLYPPQVDTFMPSFCYNEAAVVWFNISSYNEDDMGKIKFIHISMVDQRNNQNVFAGKQDNNTVYPQYYPIPANMMRSNTNNGSMGYDVNKKMYWLMIPPQLLKTAPYYNVEQYYKVQLRFDLTGSVNFPGAEGYTNPTSFFSLNNGEVLADALQLALYTDKNEDNFSEWSTGTLIKPILIPELNLRNLDVLSSTEVTLSTDIPIVGELQFKKDSNDDLPRNDMTERLSWYQVKILEDNNIVLSNNKIYSDTKIAINQINTTIDLSSLTADSDYEIQIVYETNNGYLGTVNYPITTVDYTEDTNVTCSTTLDEDNGNIILEIDLSNYSGGYLIIRRASHRSNFTHWDLIGAYNAFNHNSITVIDNTVESMTGYRYQLQYIVADELYRPVYIESNTILHCDFYGGIFSDGDKTLKTTFNFQPSNRVNAMNRTKVDTLGGQYPLFTQNSKLKYHTYSINGRISTEDDGELFLSKQEIFGNEYYNYRYNATPTSPHNAECQSIKPNNDWLYEREYRDAVEDWLNNGKPKLYRSMTEGNMVVILDTVAMSPDITLGRRLYDFNATMYEIGDGKDLDTLISLGLFNLIDER